MAKMKGGEKMNEAVKIVNNFAIGLGTQIAKYFAIIMAGFIVLLIFIGIGLFIKEKAVKKLKENIKSGKKSERIK